MYLCEIWAYGLIKKAAMINHLAFGREMKNKFVFYHYS